MQITFDFFPDQNLMMQKYSGKINKQFFLAYLKYLSENINLTSINKKIIDTRECDPVYIEQDIKEFSQFRISNLDHGEKCDTAVISSTPKTNVFTSLYKIPIEKELGHTYQICSTVEKALSILDLDFSVEEAEKRFQSLKHTFKL